MGTNHRIFDFPNFSVRFNNSKECSISGMFSALGAPRKVVDTIFESLNNREQSYDMRFPEFLNMVEKFQWNDISLPGKSRVTLLVIIVYRTK